MALPESAACRRMRPCRRLPLVLVALLGLGLPGASAGLAQVRLLEPVHVAVTSAESAEVSMDLSDPTKFPFSSTGKWTGYLDFLGKPGTKRSLGQPDLFLPLIQDTNDMTFFNLRGQLQFDNTDVGEYNIGLGHRHMFQEWIIGGYGYFDQRHTQFDNSYNQFTGGLEALSVDWAFRVNGYLPENKTETITSGANVSVQQAGNQINVQIDGLVQERALPGLDGEVGYLLPIPWEAYTAVFDETRVYAGGYHFLGQDGFESVTGPRGRVEWRAYDLPVLGPGSRFMMGVEAQWDDPRGSQAFGLASLRIPFDVFSDKSQRKALKGLDRRMLQPVIRDVDVVTSTRDLTETVSALNWQGKAFTNVDDVNPDDNLADVIDENEGEVALLVMQGDSDDVEDAGNGELRDLIDIGGPVILGEDHTLTSAGKVLIVGYQSAYLGSGSVGYTPSGTPVGIQGSITMGAGSHVNQMTVRAGAFDEGIKITSGGNHYLSYTTVQGSPLSLDGVYIVNSNLVADYLTITGSPRHGVHAVASTVTFNGDTTINGSGTCLVDCDGVLAEMGSTLTFNGDTTISGITRGHGVYASNSTLTFNQDLTISGIDNCSEPGCAGFADGVHAVGSTLTFNGDTTISGITFGHGVHALSGSTLTFNGETTISGSDACLGACAGVVDGVHAVFSTLTFNGDTTISGTTRGHGVHATNSTLTFNQDMTISGRDTCGLACTAVADGVHALGSTLTFNGDTTISDRTRGNGVYADLVSTVTFNGGTTAISNNRFDGVLAKGASIITFSGSTTTISDNDRFGAFASNDGQIEILSNEYEFENNGTAYGCILGGEIIDPSGESLC